MWVVDGSLQPYELDPAVNIALGEKKGSSRTDVFGNVWGGERSGPHAARLIPGRPEVLGDNGFVYTIDGDTTRSVAIVSGYYYYNLGWELPINRIRFFSPAEGRTQTDDRKRITPGLPLKNAYPKLYEVWAAIDGEHFKRGQFDLLLEQNLNQTTRIANARFPTQPLQFIFINFPELGVIAEVEFYGEGFVQKSAIPLQGDRHWRAGQFRAGHTLFQRVCQREHRQRTRAFGRKSHLLFARNADRPGRYATGLHHLYRAEDRTRSEFCRME